MVSVRQRCTSLRHVEYRNLMCLVNLVDPEHGNETSKISDSGKERELLQLFESDVNLNMIPNCEIDIVRDMDPYVVWPQQ